MKKKNILSLIALAAALFAASVQQAAAQIVTLPTFAVNAAATSNLPPNLIYLDISAQQNVAIKWTAQLGGAGTEVMGMKLCPSIDGTIPPNPVVYTLLVTATGATATSAQTNLSGLGGYRYLIAQNCTNANATFVLTNTIQYAVKRNAP